MADQQKQHDDTSRNDPSADERQTRADRKDAADLGFGALFKGLSQFMDALGTLSDEGGEVNRTTRFDMPGGGSAVFGLQVRSLRDAASGRRRVRVEPFGNVKRADDDAGTVTVEEVREPMVDVFDEADAEGHVLVVAEMPGVSVGDVTLAGAGDVLTLTADTGTRRYRKELLLPHPVDPDDADVRANNGIVEVRLPVSEA
jgi:HSP20 family protein